MAEENLTDILLDKAEGRECKGILVDDRVTSQIVQNLGLLQVPAYALVNGRALAGLDEPIWKHSFNCLGEKHALRIDKDYKDIHKGDYVVDIQGGGLFITRPQAIRNALYLNQQCFRTYQKDKDLLLGERQVYRWNGKKLEIVPISYFFTSFEEFSDASKTPEFRRDIRDLSAVYAVLRHTMFENDHNPLKYISESEGKYEPYKLINEQLRNPDLIIPAGGKEQLKKLLTQKDEKTGEFVPRFRMFGSLNPIHFGIDCWAICHFVQYKDLSHSMGFCVLNKSNYTIGLAPEALEQWRKVRDNLEDKKL